MSILPKQPDTLISSSPFFYEWVFCSDFLSTKSPLLQDTFQNARTKLKDLTSESQLIKYSVSQYKLLKGEFESIEKEYNDPLKIIELCLQVVNVYWEVVKKYLVDNSFRRSDHEIYFFKIIKPAFTSECEFLSLAFHALLIHKSADKDAMFWESEKQRKDKLLLEHPDFFTSYLNGLTENDEVWFKRTRHVDQCSHDHIVSSWFAIKRYEAFIESAIFQSNNLNN